MTTYGKAVVFFIVLIILTLLFIVSVQVSGQALESEGGLLKPEAARFEGHLQPNGLYRYDDGQANCIIIKTQNDVEVDCDWGK